MGRYLELKVRFRWDEDATDLVQNLHKIYKQYHMEPFDTESYEQDCEANQKCFDEKIVFEKWQHKRILWRSDWVSFVETMPVIEIIESDEDRPYDLIKSECILFPEDEINGETFSKILSLTEVLYKMKEVYSIDIIKEE